MSLTNISREKFYNYNDKKTVIQPIEKLYTKKELKTGLDIRDYAYNILSKHIYGVMSDDDIKKYVSDFISKLLTCALNNEQRAEFHQVRNSDGQIKDVYVDLKLNDSISCSFSVFHIKDFAHHKSYYLDNDFEGEVTSDDDIEVKHYMAMFNFMDTYAVREKINYVSYCINNSSYGTDLDTRSNIGFNCNEFIRSTIILQPNLYKAVFKNIYKQIRVY